MLIKQIFKKHAFDSLVARRRPVFTLIDDNVTKLFNGSESHPLLALTGAHEDARATLISLDQSTEDFAFKIDFYFFNGDAVQLRSWPENEN